MEQEYPLRPEQELIKRVVGEDALDKTLHTKVDENASQLTGITTKTTSTETKTDGLIIDVAAVQTTVDNNEAELADATHGLAALKNEIDANQVDIAGVKTVVDDTNADLAEAKVVINDTNADVATVDGKIDALDAKITSLSKSQDFYISVDEQCPRPDSSTQDFMITINHNDSQGAPDDWDSAPTVQILDNTGADVSSTYLFNNAGTQTNVTDNPYVGNNTIRFRVADNSALGLYQVIVTAIEGTVTKKLYESTYIVTAVSSAFNATDRATLNNIEVDTTSIESKVDIIDTNVDTALVNQSNIETKENTIISNQADIEGAGFISANDSLAALSTKLNNLTSNGVVGIATKQSGAIASGASETVELATSEGFTSIKAALSLIKVIPTTQTSSRFTVEIFEKAGADQDYLMFRWSKIKSTNSVGGLVLDLNEAKFFNQDTTPTNKIYVKISNVTDTASSYFDVELRFEEKA